MLKTRIDQDLKTALLAGDKTLVMTLRGLKSVILYAEVAKGSREAGLPDDEIIVLLSKELKNRVESAELYQRGGNAEKAQAELTEKAVIEAYLPKQMNDQEIKLIVEESIQSLGASGMQAMGQVIGLVKQKTAGSADGARIAALVKERLEA